VYLINAAGAAQAHVDAHGPAVLRWSDDGRFAAVGLDGEVLRVNADGRIAWRMKLPVAEPASLQEPLKPVFAEVPVYSVGRTGPEHAYVGDMWLIKTSQGGILVDAGGTSSITFTAEKMKAAGVDPKQVPCLLQTHSHGDHVGGGYLWRSMGLKIVAAESADFTMNWLLPMLSDYGVWVPRPVDVRLALKRAGDEHEVRQCGLPIRALFAPGHSVDSVIYMIELNGKRVMFTGDIGFNAQNNILSRCWGDREKAKVVVDLVRSNLIPWRPDFVFTGHDSHRDGAKFLEDLVNATVL
jgi:glyoxylase-like metal-dependent hydrolase (beta-lactamase superfamily II)